MATVSKTFALHGAHTAGIFADMSVDGPVIGTLVAIVDRAKNLPNRKTIGKQDPYCAARLGKEAKKTATDIRGGQTPKWDQELRFTVHDSADYYQLKISVFTDDKKTDLIGESWIDLKGIIISGGGQSDMWQTLTCRGKYAGEIRLEITFYDTRPKPEKPVAKARQPTSSEQEGGSPVKRKDPLKRRPLPTDPVTGETTATASVEHQTPSRPHVKQQHSHSGYASNQSPHQSTEFGTPPPQGSRQQNADPHSSSQTGVQAYTPSGRVEGPRQPRKSARDSSDALPRHQEERGYSQKIAVSPYDQPEPQGGEYSHATEPYEMAPREDTRQYSPHGNARQAPPPPPAHRSRHSGSRESLHGNGFDTSPQKATPPASMRYDVLKNEAHRHSTPSYPGRPTFRAYDLQQATNSAPVQNAITYDSPSSRHPSYDAYDPHHRSMQPTVEDVPESPTGSLRNNYRRSSSRLPLQDEMGYDNAPIPTQTSLSRSPGASAGYMSHSPRQSQMFYQDQTGNPISVSPVSARDYTNSPGEVSHHSNSSQSQRPSRQQREHETTYIQSSSSYGLPSLPPSLAPGVDPNLSQENHRGYEDRRYENRYSSQAIATPTRDRQRSEPVPPSYEPAPGTSPQAYPHQSYERRRSGVTYSNSQEFQTSSYRNASPNPAPRQEHTIRRKSVSPAPPPTENRRLSDIPFSPDSYDAFNPGASSRDGTPGLDEPDLNAKIVTHDGREVDPSDHLPMESWAPEPETKQAQAPPETRPRLSGAQPLPPSGRRGVRLSRAQPALPSPQSYGYQEDPRTPPGSGHTGRGRLQKKAHRASMGPSPSASSPLLPISPDNFQDRPSQYTPTRPSRAGTWDYQNENYAPQYHGGAHGPPIPAKVPLPIMSGANGGADEQMALMEEMQKIDIGTGRSRRRGGY